MGETSRWDQLLAKIPFATTPPPATDAQFSFRTLSNYVSGFAECIRAEFGNDFAGGATEGLQTCVAGALSQAVVPLLQAQEQALVRGWSTEVLLRQPLSQSELLLPAVHWAPVQGYYSVYGTSSVWVPGAQRHTTHLRSMSSYLAASGSLPPSVRLHALRCDPILIGGKPGQTAPSGVARAQTLVSPDTTNCYDFAGHGLGYARRKDLEDVRGKWLRDNKRKKLSSGKGVELDERLRATTVYDFLYRLRLRANYDDADAFLSGGLSSRDPERFIEDLCTMVSFLNFVAEFHIAARAGSASLTKLIPGSATSVAGEPGQCLQNRKAFWPRCEPSSRVALREV